VSTEADAPRPYRVSMSGRVYDKVRELAAVARDRGDGRRSWRRCGNSTGASRCTRNSGTR